MRELLIRYLLGELDVHEQRQLEERLRDSPRLQNELAHLQTCFAAARDTEYSAEAPPQGLARRVTDSVCGGNPSAEFGRSAAVAEPPVGALGWSLADMTVAGGVFLAVSMLLFPALRDSRDATRRTVCMDHQRQISTVMLTYARDHGFFPRIKPNQNGGMFACELVEKGYADAEELSVLLVCPSAPLADKVRSGEFTIRIPSAAELDAMSPSELADAKQRMSPFFAYQFPYRQGEQYIYLRDERSPHTLLLSDTSGTDQDMSPNHEGFVQVVTTDGSVKLLQSCRVPGGDRDLYRNADGLVAAGCSRRDVVLGRGDATPGVGFSKPAGPIVIGR